MGPFPRAFEPGDFNLTNFVDIDSLWPAYVKEKATQVRDRLQGAADEMTG